MGEPIPSYAKVLQFGTLGTDLLFDGDVVIEEKLDGSQIRWGIDSEGNFRCGTHRTEMYAGAEPKDFALAVAHLRTALPTLQGGKGIWFFGECVVRLHHNALTYASTPLHNVMLFDILDTNGDAATWYDLDTVTDWVDALGIAPPVAYHSGPSSVEHAKSFLGRESHWGGGPAEGIVCKNYGQKICLGGHVMPLFCKLVRAEFKEVNKDEHPKRADTIETLLNSYCTEARWRKAVQRMRDEGTLQNAPQDIGPLLRVIQEDLQEEESEGLAKRLFEMYHHDWLRAATRGFPEWWKAELAKNLTTGKGD